MRLTNGLLTRMKKWSKVYSNLPDRYIDRVTEQIYWKTPRGKPQYLPRTIKRHDIYFSVNRPWTTDYQAQNMAHKKHAYVHVEPILKWSFFRGDRVEVLWGPDKGKQGLVKDIYQERNWVIVEGLNTELKSFDKSKDNPGVYIRVEQPLLVTTQVKLVDPADLKPTNVEWRYTEKGEHVRVSSRTGRIVPIPESINQTVDYESPELYLPKEKDTVPEEVLRVTFDGPLKTFEMDLMDKMGIKETRVPNKYYWY